MLRIATHRFWLPGLLLAAGPVLAQAQAPDTTQRKLPARWQFGETIGLGVALVSPDDDYYLPNDQLKFGSEAQFHATYFFSRSNPTAGLRFGLGLLGRNGRYTFGAEQLRRSETLGVLPLELVSRRYFRAAGWYSEVTVGGYFAQLLNRSTYRLDPLTGTTRRSYDGWLYGVGGVVGSFSFGYHRGHRYQQLGVRFSTDLTRPRQPAAGQFPNLRAGNISLCYSLAWGKGN